MVLGFILYETIDIAYNVSKLGYNSVTGLYNWYYDIKTEDDNLVECRCTTHIIHLHEFKSIRNKMSR